jgi:hypothetical protein
MSLRAAIWSRVWFTVSTATARRLEVADAEARGSPGRPRTIILVRAVGQADDHHLEIELVGPEPRHLVVHGG